MYTYKEKKPLVQSSFTSHLLTSTTPTRNLTYSHALPTRTTFNPLFYTPQSTTLQLAKTTSNPKKTNTSKSKAPKPNYKAIRKPKASKKGQSLEDFHDKKLTMLFESLLGQCSAQGHLLTYSQADYSTLYNQGYSDNSDEIQQAISTLARLLGVPSIPLNEIRTQCYPTSFSANTLHTLYKGVPECISCHATSDLTLDHINPVAHHWNTIGYRSDRATRNTFYNDVTNLQVLCRSCNSSKNGPSYTKFPDYAHGFSN